MTDRAPFKSSVTDFVELRKRREELFPPATGDANVEPQPAPAPIPDSGSYDCYD